jgi:hypothetical protein
MWSQRRHAAVIRGGVAKRGAPIGCLGRVHTSAETTPRHVPDRRSWQKVPSTLTLEEPPPGKTFRQKWQILLSSDPVRWSLLEDLFQSWPTAPPVQSLPEPSTGKTWQNLEVNFCGLSWPARLALRAARGPAKSETAETKTPTLSVGQQNQTLGGGQRCWTGGARHPR